MGQRSERRRSVLRVVSGCARVAWEHARVGAGTSRTREIQELLWRAAEKLRGSVDAGQYKEFILGLVFLKHVSDVGALGVRWADLAGGDGAKLDAAMDAIMRDNPALAGVLPKVFRGIDQRRLKELVALIGDARFGGGKRDVLGESYEYFLERFARAEGKRAGEFYTPAGVVRLLVEVLEPDRGVVYDPCCGSGGMFVQSAKVRTDLAVRGQESNERTWRLAKMNLAIHGMDPSGLGDRWGDTFADDLHPALRADFILANPPFNQSDWQRDPGDPRWRYGVPPLSNANFAWLQLIAAKLADNGSAGVVLSNGSMSSRQVGEGAIRAALVRADLVACMVALPGNLFRTTAIPACVWFLARDKGARRGQILFVDARGLGTMVDRTERILTTSDIARIADTYRAWRGEAYENVPGFCFSASIDEVAEQDHVLTPGRYVGAVACAEETEPVADRIERLTKELYAQFEESARLESVVRDQLGRLGD